MESMSIWERYETEREKLRDQEFHNRCFYLVAKSVWMKYEYAALMEW